MQLGDGLSPTQTAHKTKRMTVFSVASVKQSVFLHSILAVTAGAVSFGTCALLWLQSKARRGITTTKTEAEALYTSD